MVLHAYCQIIKNILSYHPSSVNISLVGSEIAYPFEDYKLFSNLSREIDLNTCVNFCSVESILNQFISVLMR